MLATPFMEVLQSRLRRKRLEMDADLQRSLPSNGRRAHSATGTI